MKFTIHDLRFTRFGVHALACLLCSLALALLVHSATTSIPGPGARQSVQGSPGFPTDDFDSYSANAQLDALNGGSHWSGAYVDRFAPTGIYDQDDFESYADAAAVGGLNGGNLGWSGSYVDREGLFGLKSSDDLESYANSAAVDALNGGTGWNGPFVDR